MRHVSDKSPIMKSRTTIIPDSLIEDFKRDLKLYRGESPEPEQERMLQAESNNVYVLAGAGPGKTTTDMANYFDACLFEGRFAQNDHHYFLKYN